MKKALFILSGIALFSGKVQSQAVGGDAFLKGNLVEVGIDGSGGYEGAPWNTFAPPVAGMHFRSGNPFFGFVANPQINGWATFDGDFFTPGSPENGWGIEIGGTAGTTASNNCSYWPDQIPGAITGYSVVGSCILVDWDGNYVGGGYNLHIKITYQLKMGDLYYTTTVAVTNNGGASIPDFYYYRNVDPDNNQPISGDFTTTNTIVSQPTPTCPKAHVSAISNTPWLSYMGFAGVGTNFRVSKGGFANRDASDVWYGTGGLSSAGVSTSDEAISIGYRINPLAPGSTQTFKYVVILDDAAANNAINDLFFFTYTGSLSGPPPVCVPDIDTAQTCSGNPVTITLNATGTTASSFSWTWSPAAGLSATTGTVVTASPVTTTTYTVTGTSGGGCFAPIVQKIVVETVPGPLATYIDPGPQCGSFNLGSLVIDDANNVPGSITHFYTTPPATLAAVGSNIFAGTTITPSSPPVYLVYYDPVLGCIDYVPVNITWVSASPVVASATICNGSSTTLTATGAATYTWTPATGLSATTGSSVVANPGSTTTYTITGSSGPGCTGTTTATVTVNPIPVIVVNSPAVCSGDPAILTASGATTYTWTPATGLSATTGASVTATVGTTTTYTVTGTSLGCSGSNTATVFMNTLMDATVTPAGPFCQSAPTLTMTGADPGGTWSASCGACINSATGVFNPALASTGTNTITYTIPGGCGDTESTNVIINPVPNVVATPAAASICSGQTTGIALSSAVAGTNFDWTVSASNVSGASDNSGATIAQTLSTVLPPSGTATYTVTPSAAGCTGSPINVTITVEEVVINSIDVTPVLCFGNTDGTITINATGATGYSIDGGGTFQPSNTFTVGANTYNVVVQNANGCQASGTAVVTEPAALTAPTSSSPESCFGACDGIAGTAPTGGIAPYNYIWSSPGAGSTPFINSMCTGTYTVQVTDDNGCTVTSTVTITGPAAVSITGTTPTQPLCNGGNDGSLVINASSTVTQYSINNGGTFQASNTFGSLAAGIYDVVVTDASGCSASATVTIGQPTPLTIGSSPDASICIGQNTTISASGSGGVGPYTYTWDNGLPSASTHTVSPASTTIYNVSMTDSHGCGPVTESVTITVGAPIVVVPSANQTICPGDSAPISALASGGGGAPYTYTWTNSTSSATLVSQSGVVSPSANTIYTVTVTDGCGTPPVSATMQVNLFTLPAVVYNVDTTEGCQPVVVNFDNVTSNAASCAWDFGDGTTSTDCNAQHVFTEAGCYDVGLTVTTNDGCIVNMLSNNQVCVYPMPVAEFTFAPIPADVFAPEITFTNLTLNGNTYNWNFGGLGTSTATNPSFAFPADSGGVYTVCLSTVSDHGCADDICHEVTILDQFLIYVPNTFTPDGDGLNDVFLPKIQGENPLSYEFFVFNRWGQLVFQSNNVLVGWDGLHNGMKVKEDVYVWKIKVKKKINQDKMEFNGHVNVLR